MTKFKIMSSLVIIVVIVFVFYKKEWNESQRQIEQTNKQNYYFMCIICSLMNYELWIINNFSINIHINTFKHMTM